MGSETAYFWDKAEYPNPHPDSLLRSAGARSRDQQTQLLTGVGGTMSSGNVSDRWRLYHVHDTSVDSPMKRDGRRE